MFFFYLNILFHKKSCFLTETTVNPLLVRWIVGVGAELATFLVFLYQTDGGEIEKKEKKKSDRKERKKENKRTNERRGGGAAVRLPSERVLKKSSRVMRLA
jgi:hypothetical protein